MLLHWLRGCQLRGSILTLAGEPVHMLAKGSHSITQKQQLPQARPQHDSSATVIYSAQDLLAESEGKLWVAEERYIMLEKSLLAEQEIAATLAQELSAGREQTTILVALLDAERAGSKKLYHLLRVERHA